MDVREELDNLKFRLRLRTDEELATVLNTTKTAIDKWINRKEIPQKWRRIINLQFPSDVTNINSMQGHIINGNQHNENSGNVNIISGGNNQAGSSNTQNNYTQGGFINKHEMELLRHLIENDPENEYEDIDDIKKRLVIKDDKELAALLRVKEYIIQNIRDEGGSPAKDIQEAARVVERKIKAAAASYGGLVDEYGEWAVLRTQEYSGVVLDKKRLRLFYLITHYGSEAIVDQVTKKFEALKKTFDNF